MEMTEGPAPEAKPPIDHDWYVLLRGRIGPDHENLFRGELRVEYGWNSFCQEFLPHFLIFETDTVMVGNE
jgi:hypothetical protein